MKKLLPLVLLSYILYLLFPPSTLHPPSSALAQTSAERSLNDYQFTYGRYREAHQEFVLAKESYISSKTLSAKQKAFQSTQKMLVLRSQVLDTYFQALESFFLDSEPAAGVSADISSEIQIQRSFLQTHKAEVEEKSTLEAVLEVSLKLEDRQEQLLKTAYKVLSTTLLQREKNTTAQTESMLTEAEKVIGRVEEERDVATLRTWVGQIKDTITEARNLQTEAQNLISGKNIFSSVQDVLESSNQKNGQALKFLDELLREVKRG